MGTLSAHVVRTETEINANIKSLSYYSLGRTNDLLPFKLGGSH